MAAAELQRVAQQLGRVDIRVAVHAAEAQKFSLFQAWDEPKHALLLGVSHLRLKTHQVKSAAHLVLAAQLRDSVKVAASLTIDQSHRPHRSISERIETAAGDLFDGQTGLKIARLLERMEGNHRGMSQRFVEAQVLLFAVRAIQVVAHLPFAMAAGEKSSVIVDGLGVHNRRDSIVKIEVTLTRQ